MVVLILFCEDEQPQRGLLYSLSLLISVALDLIFTRLRLWKGLQGRSSLLVELNKSSASFSAPNHTAVCYHISLLVESWRVCSCFTGTGDNESRFE